MDNSVKKPFLITKYSRVMNNFLRLTIALWRSSTKQKKKKTNSDLRLLSGMDELGEKYRLSKQLLIYFKWIL